MGVVLESANVAVLYTASESLSRGEPQDFLSEEAIGACAQVVAGALTRLGHRVRMVPLRGFVEDALRDISPEEWMIFNLGEGVDGRLFEEPRIAWTLEAMGFAFTGAGGDALALTTHKARTKAALVMRGIPTPAWWVLLGLSAAERQAAALPYPLIVKPLAEDGSIGIGAKSIVRQPAELLERVAYIRNTYRQAAIAERFIVGREFNLALWGAQPRVLPAAEIEFEDYPDPLDCIVTYRAKWETDSLEYRHTPPRCPAAIEPELADRLCATAQHAWQAVGARGYGRVDMRLGEGGVPYVLEVNCNPDISPDAGFARSAQAAGYAYDEMVQYILELGMQAGGAA